ncbi:MAG: response regulator transcription factor [Opitutae bacterium]
MIVDDHHSIARLLADFITQQPGYELAGIAYDAATAREACATTRPNLLLLDIGLPEKSIGYALLAEVRREYPDINVLVFTAFCTMHVVQEVIRLGAHGFVEKSARFSELIDAVSRVREGQTYLGAQASALLRQAVRSGSKQSLATQELAVLRRLAHGAVAKEIATELDLSVSMIYKLLMKLRGKFTARTNEDLIIMAVAQGWLEIEAQPVTINPVPRGIPT